MVYNIKIYYINYISSINNKNKTNKKVKEINIMMEVFNLVIMEE